jgi:hypothetical protein
MLFSTVGVFISLATISMLLAPSRLSALSRPPSPDSKQVSASNITPQNHSKEADVWHPQDPTVRHPLMTACSSVHRPYLPPPLIELK